MQRRPTLSYRIFLIAVVFLLLPILILSAFLYRNDLDSHRETTLLNMQSISFKSSIYLHNLIHEDLAYLYKLGLQVPKNPNLYPTLEAQKSKLGSSTLLVLFHENGQWISKWASSEQFVGQTFNDARFIQKTQDNGFSTSIFADELATSWFFSDPDQTSNNYMLVLITPWSKLMQKIQLQSPYILSILDDARKVLASTDSLFKGKQIPAKNEMMLQGDTYSLFFEPIEDTPFSMLIAAEQSQLFGELIKRFTIEVVLVFSLIVILGLLITIFFTHKLAKPLQSLREVMRRVQDGKLQERYEPKKYGFEINDLGMQFNRALDHLDQNIEKARLEEERRLQIESELNIARKIQETLFPAKIPNLPFSLHSICLPAKEVGGDFYDILPLSKDRILIVIADSAGKGVFASLFSHSLRSLIRAFAEQEDLEKLVKKVSKLYAQDAAPLHMFTTAFIADVNPKTLKMKYCSLGHPATMLLRQDEIQELETSNLSFGLGEIESPEIKTLQLLNNDLLFFYSDGLNEQPNMENELFSKKRIINLLQEHSQSKPEDINAVILENLKQFQQEQATLDDVTFITVRVSNRPNL